jgi:CPA1 family monovalent cation:H+ antiporter
MESLRQLEIIVVLLAAVLALTTIARRLLIPYPILLVIGGLVLGALPGLPVIHLDPDLVFLVFLPPILWAAAYFTSWRDFRANLRPISLLATGLVLATTAAVAVVAHTALPGLGWAEAIALGAIVSPPDAVAATAISRRLHIPHRIVTILEGESLVNDATALVLYRVAIAAAVSGTFAWSQTLVQFVLAATVGIAAGLAVGAMARWTLGLTSDSFTEIAITLLAPYIAWVLAEQVHASGVLACVSGGLYLRQHFSAVVAPATRIQARAVWDLLVFVLNGVIFILIGLQLGALRDAVPPGRLGTIILIGALVSATAIVARLIWVPLGAWIPRVLSPSLRARDPMPPWSYLFIIAWTGMRGIVTLAGALALPLTTAAGAPFPFRAEIILITFSVILATLVLQGLSLTPLIRALKLEEDRTLEQEEMRAREHAATAALARLDELGDDGWSVPEQIDRMRVHYGRRLQRFAQNGTIDEECTLEAAEAFRRLRHETLMAERVAVIGLRNDGAISDEVLHRLEHELDVEALRLGLGERRVGM